MAFRLCFAFCLLAAGAASMARSAIETRLRERLQSDSWVARANAAALLADNPRAVRWLIPAAMDEAPPVRANARWALFRLTDLPWAGRAEECAAWWRASHDAAGLPVANPSQAPSLEDEPLEWGVPDVFDLAAVLSDGFLRVSVENRSSTRLDFGPGPEWDYSAVLFSQSCTPVRVLDPPEPPPGMLESRIWDASGRRLQTWYWNLDGLQIQAGLSASENYDLSALPPGRYLAEVIAGPVGADSHRFEGPPPPGTRGERRLLVIDR